MDQTVFSLPSWNRSTAGYGVYSQFQLTSFQINHNSLLTSNCSNTNTSILINYFLPFTSICHQRVNTKLVDVSFYESSFQSMKFKACKSKNSSYRAKVMDWIKMFCMSTKRKIKSWDRTQTEEARIIYHSFKAHIIVLMCVCIIVNIEGRR